MPGNDAALNSGRPSLLTVGRFSFLPRELRYFCILSRQTRFRSAVCLSWQHSGSCCARSLDLPPTAKAPTVPMSKKFLRLSASEGFTILHLGGMEIWDGADMALLRETLTRLVNAEKQRAI